MVKGLPVTHQQDKVARKASDISSWLAILITRKKVSNFFASVVKTFLHNTAVYMINIFFHVCLISLISCWHFNHLSHHSVRFERQSLHDSQFKVVCQDFLRWWRLDHWKIRITHRQWRSNSPRKWRKPIYEKKNPKNTYSVALVMAFLAADNENRQLEDLPQADFGRFPERLLLSVRTESINEVS